VLDLRDSGPKRRRSALDLDGAGGVGAKAAASNPRDANVSWEVTARARASCFAPRARVPASPGVHRPVTASHSLVEGQRLLAQGEQDGRVEVRLMVGPRNNTKTLQGFLNQHVADDAEPIYTDENRAYIGIGDADTLHATVNHFRKEYVAGTSTRTPSKASGPSSSGR
jgi:hypothetical protein